MLSKLAADLVPMMYSSQHSVMNEFTFLYFLRCTRATPPSIIILIPNPRSQTVRSIALGLVAFNYW